MNMVPAAGSSMRTSIALKAPATLPRWAWKTCPTRRPQFWWSGAINWERVSPNLASKSEWSIMGMTRVEFLSNESKPSIPGRALAFLGLLAALFAVGCGGVPKTSYYTLQVPAAPAPTEAKTDFVLGVEHFRAPETLRDDRVVYYVSPTQMNFYENHRWSSDPATLLSEYTAQWLGSSGVFS